jgi:hypothetical protein
VAPLRTDPENEFEEKVISTVRNKFSHDKIIVQGKMAFD